MDYAEARAVNLSNQIACKFTRDYPELLERQIHLIFVCDSLMFGCKDHSLIRDVSTSAGRAFTLNGFQFFIDDLDGTSVPFMRKESPRVAVAEVNNICRVKGEIYCVATTGIPKLDTHMKNGVQFRRRRIRVIFPYRDHWMVDNGMFDETGIELPHLLQGPRHHVSDEKVCLLWVWMYVAVASYWDDIISAASFSQVPILNSNRHWMDRYYHYPKPT